MATNNGLNAPIPFSLAKGGTGASLTASNGGLLYSTSSTAAILATADNGVLVTDGSGIPSVSTALPAGLSIPTPGIVGVTDGSDADAGNVGEFITATNTQSMTSTVNANVVSISLTAGDWDVWGAIETVLGSGTITVSMIAGINTVSATFPGSQNGAYFVYTWPPSSAEFAAAGPVGQLRISVSTTTTIYLVGYIDFSVSTASLIGYLGARRVR